MENKVLKWQIIGFVFISLVGSFFHFLFELSGYWVPIGAIAAVNESVWEHLKLAYYPVIIFACIESRYIKNEAHNFFVAKAVTAYIIPTIIVIVFYSYTALTRESILAIDLLTFYSSVLIGQIFSYKILCKNQLSKLYTYGALVAIILLGVLFVLFTYFPPHLPIFQDSNAREYGILKHYHPIF